MLSSEDSDLNCINEDFNANINFELWINIYNKSYFEGLNDTVKILNWIIKNIESDIVLLDEQSHLVLSLTQNKIYFDKNYPHFPFGDIEIN